MIVYKQISFDSSLYHETLTLRETVLRNPIDMVLRPKDTENDHNEYHFVAMDQNKLIGCVLLRPLSKTVIHLRQMAVLPSYQGKNIGSSLIHYAETFSISQAYTTIEIRARKNVTAFYAKLGFIPLKDIPLHSMQLEDLTPKVGYHVPMIKNIPIKNNISTV